MYVGDSGLSLCQSMSPQESHSSEASRVLYWSDTLPCWVHQPKTAWSNQCVFTWSGHDPK